MPNSKKKTSSKQNLKNAKMHMAAALIYGYNEMAKNAQTLGEKVYLRMAREDATEKFRALGGEVNVEFKQTILTICGDPVFIKFTVDDIELMRRTVAEYDAMLPVNEINEINEDFNKNM